MFFLHIVQGLRDRTYPLEEVEALTKFYDVARTKICATLLRAFVGTNFDWGAQHNSKVSLCQVYYAHIQQQFFSLNLRFAQFQTF